MSVKLYVGGRSAYTFLNTESAQEFVKSQSEAVRTKWPTQIRITRGSAAASARQPGADGRSGQAEGQAHNLPGVSIRPARPDRSEGEGT